MGVVVLLPGFAIKQNQVTRQTQLRDSTYIFNWNFIQTSIFFMRSLVQDWGMFQPNLNEANKLNKQKSNQKVCVALQEKYHRMQRAHRVSAGRRKN